MENQSKSVLYAWGSFVKSELSVSISLNLIIYLPKFSEIRKMDVWQNVPILFETISSMCDKVLQVVVLWLSFKWRLNLGIKKYYANRAVGQTFLHLKRLEGPNKSKLATAAPPVRAAVHFE